MPEPLTEREETMVALVSRAFAGRMVEAAIVDVNKLEGGQVATLRFTVDEGASTDLERGRIAQDTAGVEALAAEIEAELRRQLP